jgi:hypothetical protein
VIPRAAVLKGVHEGPRRVESAVVAAFMTFPPLLMVQLFVAVGLLGALVVLPWLPSTVSWAKPLTVAGPQSIPLRRDGAGALTAVSAAVRRGAGCLLARTLSRR